MTFLKSIKAIVVERWNRRRCEGLDQKRPPPLRWFIILLTADCHFRSQTARQLKVWRRRRPSSLAIANCVAASQNNLCNSNVAWATHVPDQVKDSSTYLCMWYVLHAWICPSCVSMYYVGTYVRRLFTTYYCNSKSLLLPVMCMHIGLWPVLLQI